ncbi:MAG: 23S rRNA (adenine(2503)-C(2))-methyltransferase RlmN [Methylacidiphilales bacterium]|nr:23S rRNA (adenine(2503)-C(2))-methyltransferase RlmN [Candidatus Methylacidiphilales bacterium]MDW8349619.1 23S rRNA (adenine(2503)-C(2))-methyltransferase RlmN [Verrucomicrobiae bacterium]
MLKPFLLDHLPDEWEGMDKPSYRKDQVLDWIFKKATLSFLKMSNLPLSFRHTLEDKWELNALSLVKIQGSSDSTQKFLWRLRSGDYIESVLIPANIGQDGQRSKRLTVCLSTQVGCAYGCKFCASGLEGWKRNLSPAEIVSQILQIQALTQTRVDNLVFMGMGEPLANFDSLMRALEIIHAPWGLNIGARHVTISTSGLVPQILKLADRPEQFALAISLHAATDDIRNKIMPINRKYPLSLLLEACASYQKKKNRLITFEYILIEDLNDSLEQATLLAQHAKRIRAKINLIPYNKVDPLPWRRPSPDRIQAFLHTLRQHGVSATVRHEKGHDIDAACGQLRLKQLQNHQQLLTSDVSTTP